MDIASRRGTDEHGMRSLDVLVVIVYCMTGSSSVVQTNKTRQLLLLKVLLLLFVLGIQRCWY